MCVRVCACVWGYVCVRVWGGMCVCHRYTASTRSMRRHPTVCCQRYTRTHARTHARTGVDTCITERLASQRSFGTREPMCVCVCVCVCVYQECLTPPSLFYVRNHLPVPERPDINTYRVKVSGLGKIRVCVCVCVWPTVKMWPSVCSCVCMCLRP